MSQTGTKALIELLQSLFSADELRRFVALQPGENVSAALPSGSVSLAALAFEVVGVLERYGQLDEAFFKLLEQERPARRGEITRVQALLPGSMIPASLTATVPRLDEDPSVQLAAYAAWARQRFEYLPMRGLGGLRLACSGCPLAAPNFAQPCPRQLSIPRQAPPDRDWARLLPSPSSLLPPLATSGASFIPSETPPSRRKRPLTGL